MELSGKLVALKDIFQECQIGDHEGGMSGMDDTPGMSTDGMEGNIIGYFYSIVF